MNSPNVRLYLLAKALKPKLAAIRGYLVHLRTLRELERAA